MRVTRSQNIGWTGRVALMGLGRILLKWFWVKVNLKERDHLEYLDVDGTINIKYNLNVDWIRLAQDSNHMSGCCDHGNESSGSIM